MSATSAHNNVPWPLITHTAIMGTGAAVMGLPMLPALAIGGTTGLIATSLTSGLQRPEQRSRGERLYAMAAGGASIYMGVWLVNAMELFPAITVHAAAVTALVGCGVWVAGVGGLAALAAIAAGVSYGCQGSHRSSAYA